MCKGAWHAECYAQHSGDRFPVLRASDLDDALLTEEDLEDDEPDRFKHARAGDHLMCPFQCDRCHFVNLQGRFPGARREDDTLLLCIRRANLDAMWSRETSTVQSNLREHLKLMSNNAKLGLQNPYPQRGPFAEEDSFGMGLACACLIRSMDAGNNADTIQFETMRKLRSHYANFVHTTPNGTGMAAMSGDSSSTFFSNSASNSYWFRRFMQGVHKRMGDVWIPDRAITIDEVLRMMTLLEEDWTAQLAGLDRSSGDGANGMCHHRLVRERLSR